MEEEETVEQLEQECKDLQEKMLKTQADRDVLREHVSKQKAGLTELRLMLDEEQVNLSKELQRQGGTSSLEFETHKLELIERGSTALSKLLVAELVAMARRYPGQKFPFYEGGDLTELSPVVGPTVEGIINQVADLEQQLEEKRQEHASQAARNKQLAETLSKLSESSPSEDLELEPNSPALDIDPELFDLNETVSGFDRKQLAETLNISLAKAQVRKLHAHSSPSCASQEELPCDSDANTLMQFLKF